MSSRMQNLTLASAQHLLNQGHITPDHHKKIVAKAMQMKPMKMPGQPKPYKPPAAFGSLAKGVATPLPTPGAQAPIPGVGGGPPVIPPGMASGYDDQ